MRLLRVAPGRQTALELGPAVDGPAAAAERWWRLPEPARLEVIAMLARLIARGVLVEEAANASPVDGPAGASIAGAPGSGEPGE